MDDKEIVLKLIDYFIPEASDDEVFMQYLIERLDSYFDYSFLEQMRDSLKWRVIDCVQKTREDYAFMTDTTHHVYLDSQKKEIHFGEYVLPAYWYKEEMQKKEVEETLLRYKLIWKKLDYGEIHFPLLEDWRSLSAWREQYSEPLLCRMEKDLEAGTEKDALRLYYLYSRRASMREIERVYPDKIKQILSVSNQTNSEEGRTADLTILLYDGSKCSVRVGTDNNGRYCSTTALTKPGFPLFTDHDKKLIQKTVFDCET